MKTHSIRGALLLSMMVLLMGGCSGYRLVIDVVPAVDHLVETTVMKDEGARGRGDKIALIDVNGVISDSGGFNLMGKDESPVSRFTEALGKAAKDKKVRAVILGVNSPGGTVTASDLMYRELVHFRESTGKPVIVLMGAVAASGAYYLSMGADELIANPTTVTGSIGVIMQTVNFSEGLNRIGIRAEAITSGPNKSVGNPFEPMSAEHRALLQGIVNELYTTFREIVVAHRPNLDPDKLNMITDGRVVTGPTAVELGVVDRLGDIRDAMARAKQLAGISTARLVKYHRATQYVGSAYAQTSYPGAGASQGSGLEQTQINLMQLNLQGGMPGNRSQFLYLWDPMSW